MNIFHIFARKSLRCNRARTIVTIVGIILSVAMITAVTSIISSIQAYGIAYEEKLVGDWHVKVGGADAKKLLSLREDHRIDRIYELQNIGYAYLEGGINFYKPYLCIQAMNEGFAEHMPIRLTEGRMPQNDVEVLIPNHVEGNGGVKIELGDVLELEICYRENEEGELLWQEDSLVTDMEPVEKTDIVLEHLTAGEKKAYKVVGFYDRPDFENYSAPGYTVLTLFSTEENFDGDGALVNLSSICDCYIVMKHPKDAIGLWEEIRDEGIYLTNCNNSLLRFYGYSVRSDFNDLLYGMGSILIVIIVFGSVALIYNAFAISVSERTKQFGLLTSVGATRKQMRQTVCYEALLLCLIGIPLGIFSGILGIGITLSFFSDVFEYLIGSETGVEMKLSISAGSIAAASVIGLITVLISAYLPMRRALKVSAIDAIRQKRDIKLTKKSVRIPKWVGRCFGLEGMIAWKNFKRNKKQYRTTIISLSMSILLFVSAGCFSDYLFGGYNKAVEMSPYDLNCYLVDENIEPLLETMELIRSLEHVTMVYECISTHTLIKAEEEKLSDAAKQQYKEESSWLYSEEGTIEAAVVFLPEDIFGELLSFYNLVPETYQDRENPKAVVLNSMIDSAKMNEGMKAEDTLFPVLKEQCRNVTCVIEGEGIASGKTERILEIGDVIENKSMAPEFSEQCRINFPGVGYEICLIYPISAAKEVVKDGISRYQLNGNLYFLAENHSQSAVEMKQQINSTGSDTGSGWVFDAAASEEEYRAMQLMINVFCYGFIILISLISAANVFNTISTNMGLRRREFAMLKSVGMTQRDFARMINFECLIYGMKGLTYGFLISILAVVSMYYFGNGRTMQGFYLPYRYVIISALCVFAVVYVTMLYGRNKGKKDNIIDALKGDVSEG